MRLNPSSGRHLDAAMLLALAGTAAPWLARHWSLADLVTQFLQQVAWSTLGVLGLSVLLRHRCRALVAAGLLGVQLSVMRPDLSGPRAVAGDARAQVLFLNVWTRNTDHAETLDFVRASGADVVVLAEVAEHWPDAIAALADTYPWRTDCLAFGGCDVVLLSRNPLLSATAGREPHSGTPYVEARVWLGGREMTIVGTHLTRPLLRGWYGRQAAQASFLAGRLGAIGGPKLLVGDLNAVPWGAVARVLTDRTGLTPVAGITGSWPSPLPALLRIPIDLALASAELGASVRQVGPQLGSDHRPIMVDLRVPQRV